MKCGPIYKEVDRVADGQYEGTISGCQVEFKTETGKFMTRSSDYVVLAADVPVVVTIKGNQVEVEVKK